MKKQKYEKDVIVVTNGFRVGDILYYIHKKWYDNLNKVRIRTMFNKVDVVNMACVYMKSVGYVKEITKKEIVVTLKDGHKMNNIEYEIELINKFHKFNED